MVKTGGLKAPSDWQTERDPVKVAVLGKLGEESAELSNIIFRSIIQGTDGIMPKTGQPNLEILLEEMADVRALSDLVEHHFNIKIDPVRVKEKYNHKSEWLKLIHP